MAATGGVKQGRGPGVLRRNADFRRLFLADTISNIGTEVSYLAISLLAVITLQASPFQLGVLQACSTLAFLLVGLPAGAWVDRLAKRPMMLATDFSRFVLYGSIPLAAAFDMLTLTQLFVVVALAGVATVLFDIAHYAYLPAVVERPDLTEANGRFAATHTVAQVAGPGVSGLVVRLVGAPVAVLVDAISYLLSFGYVLKMSSPEPERTASEQRHLVAEIKEGLSFLVATPTLRRIALCTAAFNFVGSVEQAITVIFQVRTLGLGAGVIGLLFSISGIGGVVGALTAHRFVNRFGLAAGIRLVPMVCAPFTLLIPLTQNDWRLAFFCIGFGMLGFSIAIFNVSQNSYRQAAVPPVLLGRVSASLRFLTWGSMPVGALIGGALAGVIGIRPTLWATCVGFVLVVLLLLRIDPDDVEAALRPQEDAEGSPSPSP
jgi:MFS family permease